MYLTHISRLRHPSLLKLLYHVAGWVQAGCSKVATSKTTPRAYDCATPYFGPLKISLTLYYLCPRMIPYSVHPYQSPRHTLPR